MLPFPERKGVQPMATAKKSTAKKPAKKVKPAVEVVRAEPVQPKPSSTKAERVHRMSHFP